VLMRFVVTRRNGVVDPVHDDEQLVQPSWPMPPMPGKVKLSRPESRVCDRTAPAGRARCRTPLAPAARLENQVTALVERAGGPKNR
jgi:hypothetical protein